MQSHLHAVELMDEIWSSVVLLISKLPDQLPAIHLNMAIFSASQSFTLQDLSWNAVDNALSRAAGLKSVLLSIQFWRPQYVANNSKLVTLAEAEEAVISEIQRCLPQLRKRGILKLELELKTDDNYSDW